MQLKHLLYFGALLLASCKSKTTLPIEQDIVEITMSNDEIICTVRSVANQQSLRFYFGSSDQHFGSMNTFRLIGKGFEITMVNAESNTKYDVRAYNMSSDAAVDATARKEFKKFLDQLRVPREECTGLR